MRLQALENASRVCFLALCLDHTSAGHSALADRGNLLARFRCSPVSLRFIDYSNPRWREGSSCLKADSFCTFPCNEIQLHRAFLRRACCGFGPRDMIRPNRNPLG
jgi:hypothetical protein